MFNEASLEWFARLVERAEEMREELETETPQAAFKTIKATIKSHDIVFGVWRDTASPRGVGNHIIKGADLLRNIAETGQSQERSIVAIPCISHEQAIAASQVMGDGMRAH